MTTDPSSQPSPPGASTDDLLEIAVHHPGPRVSVLQIAGEVDTLSADLVEQRLTALLADRPDLIVDLSQVRFLGSSGLRVLMSAHAAAEASYGTCTSSPAPTES